MTDFDASRGSPPIDKAHREKQGASKTPASEEYFTSSHDKSRSELEAAKEYAEMVVNTIRDGLLILDLDLRVKSANRSFYKMFETTPEDVEGRLVYEIGNGQWDIPELKKLLEDILPERKSFDDFEVDYEFDGIGRRVMLLNARRINHHDMILLAIDDISERRIGERRLLESQERFDLFMENAKEYAIFMMDEDATITMWNTGAERLLGWREEEILGRGGDVIFTKEDREAGAPEKEVARAKRRGAARDNRWHVRKDGSRFWATGFLVALHTESGELRGLTKIIRDDTQQKITEEQREELLEALEQEQEELRSLNETLEERVEERTRQVRMLASTLTMAEQEERRRISQILHDDLQQHLYGVQLKLTFTEGAIESERVEEALAHLKEINNWLSQGIDITRNLTVDLSPPILQNEGLTETLRWLQSQMKELHGLEVEIQAEKAFRTPDEDMRVLLFQIVRELLFNVVKHANTRKATVAIEDCDSHVRIVVVDEGEGFDVAAAEAEGARDAGFGLFSVRERLSLFGGDLDVDSAPGKGTTVVITIPLELR